MDELDFSVSINLIIAGGSTILSGSKKEKLGNNIVANVTESKVTSHRRGKEEDIPIIVAVSMDGITAGVSTLYFSLQEFVLGDNGVGKIADIPAPKFITDRNDEKDVS